MKTFKDLVFKPHYSGMGQQARMNFEDGTEISVICGSSLYYCDEGTFEMMSSRINRNGGVRGYLSPEQITKHMKYVQKNPKKKEIKN